MAARTLNRLTALQVGSLGPGRHADGGGLYLTVDAHGRGWMLRLVVGGRRRDFGLGGVHKVSLAQARAVEYRSLAYQSSTPWPPSGHVVRLR